MNKVLEYMDFAKPQVSFDLVETRASALDAGIYVTEVSPQKLAETIVATLDNPTLRQQMGARGHRRLHTDLNWEKSVTQLLAAYDAALGKWE
jgi:glycosyltransferase involved in cell wall biosynthesis